MTFTTKDSGERREFGTGSVRDTNAGKPRFDLLPIPALKRWADLMARGADKYGERNWELGQSMSRFEESALRHLYQYLEGDRDEDHLAAVLFNVGGIVHHEAEIAAGRLPASLDDRRTAATFADLVTPYAVDLDTVRAGYHDSPRTCYAAGEPYDPHYRRLDWTTEQYLDECGFCGITVEEAARAGHLFRS